MGNILSPNVKVDAKLLDPEAAKRLAEAIESAHVTYGFDKENLAAISSVLKVAEQMQPEKFKDVLQNITVGLNAGTLQLGKGLLDGLLEMSRTVDSEKLRGLLNSKHDVYMKSETLEKAVEVLKDMRLTTANDIGPKCTAESKRWSDTLLLIGDRFAVTTWSSVVVVACAFIFWTCMHYGSPILILLDASPHTGLSLLHAILLLGCLVWTAVTAEAVAYFWTSSLALGTINSAYAKALLILVASVVTLGVHAAMGLGGYRAETVFLLMCSWLYHVMMRVRSKANEQNMQQQKDAELSRLQLQLAQQSAAIEALTSDNRSLKKADLQKRIAELQTSIEEQKAADKQQAVARLTQEREELLAKLAAKRARQASRQAGLAPIPEGAGLGRA